MKLRILTLLFLTFSLTLSAQSNKFLSRDYWKSKPDVAAVKADVAAGNDPAQSNENAFDATVFAILEDASKETVDFLLSQKGNDVNKITHDGRTYLFWAAYKGNVALMEQLVKAGGKTDLIEDHGYTVLNFAAANGQSNTAVYDFMLAHGADLKKDVDHNGTNALLLAAPYASDFKLLNYFADKGLSLDALDPAGNSAFDYAARTGNVAYLGQLIKRGVPFSNNAFLFASQGTRGKTNPIETYEFLKSLRLNPAAKGKNGENALHYLAGKPDQADIMKWFVANGADVNLADNDGNTPFMRAAASGDASGFAYLAMQCNDYNARNKKGQTALMFAAASRNPAAVSGVLARQSIGDFKAADLKIRDNNGDDVSAYLIQSFHPNKAAEFQQKLDHLKKAGLAFPTVQGKGNTLYHLAITKNDVELLKLLSAYKIDVNAKSADGLSALHKAAMTSKDDVLLKYLISLGAKKDLKTDMAETAYDLARENEALKGQNLQFLK